MRLARFLCYLEFVSNLERITFALFSFTRNVRHNNCLATIVGTRWLGRHYSTAASVARSPKPFFEKRLSWPRSRTLVLLRDSVWPAAKNCIDQKRQNQKTTRRLFKPCWYPLTNACSHNVLARTARVVGGVYDTNDVTWRRFVYRVVDDNIIAALNRTRSGVGVRTVRKETKKM